MNSEDVFQLVRSGSLFAAMSPSAARDMHLLRRYLAVDCPNTYQELEVHSDGSIARGQVMDAFLRTIRDCLRFPRVEHFKWHQDASAPSNGGVQQGGVVAIKHGDEPLTSTLARTPPAASHVAFHLEDDPFYARGCVLFTVPRRIDYRFHNLALDTPEETKNIHGSPPTNLHCVTGRGLHSIAAFKKPLCNRVRHRCSVQVLALPKVVNAAATVADGTTTPRREAPVNTALPAVPMSPSKAMADTYYDTQKPMAPHCCFGIYCPQLPEEPHINQSLQHRASFTSRRWLGVYWADGTAVPTLGLVGSVTTAGVVRATPLKERATIRVGDVLTIETRPEDDDIADGTCGTVLFYLNGAEVARVTTKITMPVATRMDESFFAVRLSEGASVASFAHIE